MSGGSFDYLCAKDIDELVNDQSLIQNMADELTHLGYAFDVALDTEEIKDEIQEFKNKLEVKVKRLQLIWRAMEWWQSGDNSEDSFKAALSKHRGENDN